MTAQTQSGVISLKLRNEWAVWITLVIAILALVSSRLESCNEPAFIPATPSITEEKVNEIITTRLEPFQVKMDNAKESIDRVEGKVDNLDGKIDRLLQRRYSSNQFGGSVTREE